MASAGTGTIDSVSVAATTIYTLTATNAIEQRTATTGVVVGQNPPRATGGRSCCCSHQGRVVHRAERRCA